MNIIDKIKWSRESAEKESNARIENLDFYHEARRTIPMLCDALEKAISTLKYYAKCPYCLSITKCPNECSAKGLMDGEDARILLIEFELEIETGEDTP